MNWVLVLDYLDLSDLAQVRLISSRMRRLVNQNLFNRCQKDIWNLLVNRPCNECRKNAVLVDLYEDGDIELEDFYRCEYCQVLGYYQGMAFVYQCTYCNIYDNSWYHYSCLLKAKCSNCEESVDLYGRYDGHEDLN